MEPARTPPLVGGRGLGKFDYLIRLKPMCGAQKTLELGARSGRVEGCQSELVCLDRQQCNGLDQMLDFVLGRDTDHCRCLNPRRLQPLLDTLDFGQQFGKAHPQSGRLNGCSLGPHSRDVLDTPKERVRRLHLAPA